MADLVLEDANGVGDLFLGEDIDLSDETVLRNLQTVVEELIGDPRGVRVSVLSADQWLTAVDRLVPQSLRRGVRQHFHVLADPNARGHLLVGPGTLAGLNEKSHQIIAEVTYAMLKAGRPVPPPIFQRGSADLLASVVAERFGEQFFTHNYPREAVFCAEIVAMLQIDHKGFTDLEWLSLLKTNPRQFFMAIRRSTFSQELAARAREIPEIVKIAGGEPLRRTSLVTALASPDLQIGDPLFDLTRQCLTDYREAHTPKPSKKGARKR